MASWDLVLASTHGIGGTLHELRARLDHPFCSLLRAQKNPFSYFFPFFLSYGTNGREERGSTVGPIEGVVGSTSPHAVMAGKEEGEGTTRANENGGGSTRGGSTNKTFIVATDTRGGGSGSMGDIVSASGGGGGGRVGAVSSGLISMSDTSQDND